MLYTNAMVSTIVELIYTLTTFLIFSGINRLRSVKMIFLMFLASLPLAVINNIDFLLGIILFVLCLYLLRKKSWQLDRAVRDREIINLFIILIAKCLVENLMSIIALYFFRPRLNTVLSADSVTLWFIVILSVILETIVSPLLARFMGNRRLDLLENKIVISQFLFLLLTLYLSLEILKKAAIQGVYQSLLLLFIVVQMVFTIYQTLFHIHKAKQEQETVHMKAQLNLMGAYTRELDRHYLQIKQFRHDYLTMLAGLDYLKGKEHQPTRDYFQKMLAQATQALDRSVMRFGELANIQLTSIKVLLMTKLNEAQQKGLQLSFTCPHQLQDIAMNELEFAKLLTILSDRAIDLAMHSKNKQLAFILIATKKNLKIMINSSFEAATSGEKVEDSSDESYDTDLSGFLRQHPYIECFHAVDHNIDQITLTIMKESVSG